MHTSELSAIFYFLCYVFSDEFDAAAIADKLKIIAAKLNDDVAFKAALNDFKKAVAQEVGCIPLFAPI